MYINRRSLAVLDMCGRPPMRAEVSLDICSDIGPKRGSVVKTMAGGIHGDPAAYQLKLRVSRDSCRFWGVRGANVTKLALVADLPEHSAADLAAADQEELQRAEARQVGVVQDPLDVVGVERLDLVQTDEDVAALDPGPGRGAVRVERVNEHPAAKLRVRLGDKRRIDRRQTHAELVPHDVGGRRR